MPFNPAAYPLRIVAKYLIFGLAWIILSDMAVELLSDFDSIYSYIQTVKGVVFILVTAILLYLILKKDFHEIDSACQKQKANEKRYHTAFKGAPDPLWEKNLSNIKSELERLNLSGSSSVYGYIRSHQTFLQECLEKIEVLDVNSAVLKTFGVKTTDDIKIPCARLLGDSHYAFLKQEIAAIADGRTEFEMKQRLSISGREEKILLIRWAVLPGHEATYDRVLVSAFDITRLENITKQLQESEEKYRGLFEYTGEAVMVVEVETILLANSASEKLFDLSLSSLYKSTLNQLIYPDDQSVLEEYCKKAPEEVTGKDQLTFRITRRDKELRWVEVRVSRTPWQGKPVFLMLFADITEKIKKDQQLKQAKLFFEKVFNSLEEAVFVIDATNRSIVTCNPAVESIFGYAPEEINGKTTRILHLDDSMYEKFAQQSEPILEQKRVFHTQFVMRHKDGSQIITEVTVTGIDDVLGWRHGVVSVLRDITEQKMHEKALQESEKRYRNLLEDANEGVVVIQDEIIVYTNSQMQFIVGYDDEQLVGSLYLEYVYTADKEAIALLYQNLMTGKGFPKDKELRVLTKEGNIRWLRVNAVRLDWSGKPAVMALGTDITEEKLLQEKNREMEAHILQAQKLQAIGTLAGGIAHDFNNLLSVILGFSRLTLDDLDADSQMYENIQMVIEAGKRAEELVSQILMFSRKADEKRIVLQANLVVKEAIKMLRSTIPSHIVINQAIRSAKYIEMDPGQLHRIVMNLCTNAYHAMIDTGGKLTIELTDYTVREGEVQRQTGLAPGNYLRLAISDTGCGIEPEIIDSIFDPYFTTKDMDQGTGLGLSVVHGIVNSVGGIVTVKSEPGKGSRFDVYLPAYQKSYEVESFPDETVTICDGGDKCVLVVDDETAVLRLMGIYLRSSGYDVVTSERAEDALNILRNDPKRFDIVITDFAMPGMTGMELASELAVVCPETPVILSSGFAPRKSLLEEKNNILALLQKPFTKATLLKTISQVLDHNNFDNKLNDGSLKS